MRPYLIIMSTIFAFLLTARAHAADDCETVYKQILYKTSGSLMRLDENTVGIIADGFSAKISCKGALPAARVSTVEETLPLGFLGYVAVAGEAATGIPRETFLPLAQDCSRRMQKSSRAEISMKDDAVVFCGPLNVFVATQRPKL